MDGELHQGVGAVAPPVVAVVVVHDPGPWFEETLASLAAQDYPNLNTMFLLAGGSSGDHGDVAERARAVLPDAFVEVLAGNPGFAAAANGVLDLVEGDNGFFCICHDDVALETDAIRLLVEELYRSNAGIIGPKLVAWDNSRLLLNVGLDVDRVGQPASRVEAGEFDQEQHDAVTDVFAVPSACLLVRADLFRALGGFDASMTFHGEDVDLCWRAHVNSARVLVAPSARVRHREELESRRPDLNHEALRQRHRVRSTMTLTSGSRLPLRLLELVASTIIELVVGVFTGHPREAWASVRALVGAIPRFPTLLARRGSIAKQRQVSDAEVQDLQARGSNRLRSFRQSRDTQTFVGVEENVRRWRERSLAPVITWLAVVVAVLVASRTFINGSVPTVGEFIPYPNSPRQVWSDFLRGWDEGSLGATSANPTGLAVLSASSVLWLWHMGLGLTATIVGGVLLGGLGVWRLADVFPSNRERVVALITYVAMPLLPNAISTGRLSTIVAFAALPWFVHLVRLAAGIGTADPASVAVDLPDGIIDLDIRERARRIAVAGLVVAVAVAIAPPVLLLVAGVTLVLGVSTLLVGASWRTAAWMTASGAVACLVGWLLNAPGSTTWSWDSLTAIPLAGADGRGLAAVATMDIGRARLGLLAIALYVPVVTGLTLSRAWRLSWAARAAGLVLVFGLLAVLQDRDAAPFRLPDIGILLVPVALGLAVSAACAVASFVSDVAGGTFGWRQPLGLLSIGAVLCGIFPSLVTVADGRWFAPTTTMTTLLAPQIAADEVGDFRILYLGDPRLLPPVAHDLGGGVAMAVTGPGSPDIRDRWAPPSSPAVDSLRQAVTDIAAGITQRGGRLLAPYAIRFIVVPRYDGAVSTLTDPVPLPLGLVDAFGVQLDLRHLFTSPSFEVFENASAFPRTTAFSGEMADATAATDTEELVRRDLSANTPVLDDAVDTLSKTGDVPAGTLHVSVPFDDNWTLRVGDEQLTAAPSFGTLTGYEVPTAGAAVLRYESPSSRRTALLGQALAWLLALAAASRMRMPSWLARKAVLSGERAGAVIELADEVALPTQDGEIPVVVPLEPVAGEPVTVAAPVVADGPLFGADESEHAAWIDEMFADEDDDDDEPLGDLGKPGGRP